MAVLRRKLRFIKAFFLILLLLLSASFYHCWWLPNHIDNRITSIGNSTPFSSISLLKGETFNLWDRLHVNWTKGSNILVFLHIQRTAGKSFLYSIGSATQYNKSLCTLIVTSNDITNITNLPKSWRLLCPIANAAYYPTNSSTAHLQWWPHTIKPLTLKELRKQRRMKPLPEMWFLSEVTYQWPCGIHSFLTAMLPCIEKLYIKRYGNRQREYHYFTILRHPVFRYLSEYIYTRQGKANWDIVTGVKHCTGALSERTVPECYPGIYRRHPWYDVSLKTFISCPHNWANNRQVWMLADLKHLQCGTNNRSHLNRVEFENSLLESAKKRLESMAFFGIADYLRESSLLFQYRFNVNLLSLPTDSVHVPNEIVDVVLSDKKLFDKIVQLNRLDMMLYNHSLNLFRERLKLIGVNIKFKEF